MEGQTVKVTYKQKLPAVLSKTQEVITKKGWWGVIYIHNGRWQQLQMGQQCRSVDSWEIRRGLQLYGNQQKNILCEIKDISFPYLMYLSLENNLIQSIEVINSVKMPMLTQLQLCLNKISNVTSLRKFSAHNLQGLSLSGNLIKQYNSLSEVKASGLKVISLQFAEDYPYSSSLESLAKLQSSRRLKSICAWSSTRIPCHRIYESLKNRSKIAVVLGVKRK